jgi:hypothetical protein
MTREEPLARLTINPHVCFGKPGIRGHRIWVSLIQGFLASGMAIQEILSDLPTWKKPISSRASPTARMWHEGALSKFRRSPRHEAQVRRHPGQAPAENGVE